MAIKSWVLAGMAAVSVLAAAPAAAVQTVYVDFDPLSSARNFLWARTGGNGGTFYTYANASPNVAGATPVTFSLVGSPVPLSVVADFFLTGTTLADPLGSTNPSFTQRVDSFTFGFTATTSFCWGQLCFNPGDSLMSGTVTSSAITGTLGTQGPALFSGTTGTGSGVTISSPLVSFLGGSNLGFAFDLTNLDRSLVGGVSNSLGSFRGNIGGNFSSDPVPVFNVPEPGTWALMIVGMGLVGMARRRRRTVVTA
jgi:hypothetical protein